MCIQSSASGVIGLPADRILHTGIEKCQRTATFVNGSADDVIVFSGLEFIVPSGKALTIPIVSEIRITGKGDGVILWSATSAVLAPQLVDTPVMSRVADPIPTVHQMVKAENIGTPSGGTNAEIFLPSGNYTKLVFIVGGQ